MELTRQAGSLLTLKGIARLDTIKLMSNIRRMLRVVILISTLAANVQMGAGGISREQWHQGLRRTLRTEQALAINTVARLVFLMASPHMITTKNLMRIRILRVFCLFSCLILEIGCRANATKMEAHSDNPSINPQKERRIVYCWFVEDNGTGHSGYAVMDTFVGRALQQDERLFPTLGEVHHALMNQDGRNPIIIPKQPDWVPQAWRVRDLSTNEVSQIVSFEHRP